MRPPVPLVVMAAGVGIAAILGAGQAAARPAGGERLPSGVMTATAACRHVVRPGRTGFFVGPKRVHLVLTTYARGEPIQSQGDVSTGMPPRALVWVVEVHARAVHWNHSVPAGYQAPGPPYTDFSVVMNARTGRVSDEANAAAGRCRCGRQARRSACRHDADQAGGPDPCACHRASCALTCRIARVDHTHIHALFGIFHRDLVAAVIGRVIWFLRALGR